MNDNENSVGGQLIMIDIAVSVDFENHNKEYDCYLATLISSLSANSSQGIRLHLLCRGMPSVGFKSIMEPYCKQMNVELCVHQVNIAPVFMKMAGCRMWSPAISNRFYLARLLPDVGRVLFLDADIVVCHDIEPLWEMDMGGAWLAGVHYPVMDKQKNDSDIRLLAEEKHMLTFEWVKTWVNGGVLLFDLGSIRCNFDMAVEAENFAANHPQLLSFDEFFLNSFMGNFTKLLGTEWNYSLHHLNYEAETQQKQDDIVLLHYADSSKPLRQVNGRPDMFFWKYFKYTPYYNNEYMDSYFDNVSQLKNTLSYINDFHAAWRKRGNIAIMGTGRFAQMVLDYLSDKYNVIPNVFLDNDTQRQIMGFKGFQVLSPEDIISKKEDYVIVLGIHGKAIYTIYNHLNMLGFVEQKDFFAAERIFPDVMH